MVQMVMYMEWGREGHLGIWVSICFPFFSSSLFAFVCYYIVFEFCLVCIDWNSSFAAAADIVVKVDGGS